jgi:hypothetical protein
MSRGRGEPLFSPGKATDPAYLNLRSTASSEYAQQGRAFTEKLWTQYWPYADNHFTTEIRRDFRARFWEMYLTCALLQCANNKGFSISCPKTGPDILIEFKGRRIWIEAVTANKW